MIRGIIELVEMNLEPARLKEEVRHMSFLLSEDSKFHSQKSSVSSVNNLKLIQ